MADPSMEDDTNWTLELETALIGDCDFNTIRKICKARAIPPHLRQEVWLICLNLTGKGDQMSGFDELYDLPEQDDLRHDCNMLVDKLGNEEEEKVSVASDIESILTFYCKSRGESYSANNGWLDILQPMLALKMNKAELYNTFYTIVTKYIPKDCVRNGRPFQLFRLLLLYHDPELCSFLDSRKVTPDVYAAPWFQGLFATQCDLAVILNMWDVYLQHADPFLVFFLALVIVVNAKEQILTMEKSSKQEIIEKLQSFPSALEAEDVEDFCNLAQYYSQHTPQSFRRNFQMPLFGSSLSTRTGSSEVDLQAVHALCLPVAAADLIQANQPSNEGEVRYFVVDCRPAEQYNSGHLPIAFHLDANLMLQNPTEFSTTVQALLAAKTQALAAGSVASGEHLCLVGSGREEEDQYVHMVVAHFLQKHTMYVGLAAGGYAALHDCLRDDLTQGLTCHTPRSCIVCNPSATGINGANEEEGDLHDSSNESLIDRFEKLSSVVKSKSASMKDKMINYIKNEPGLNEKRHVSHTDKIGRRYRNMASVFTIGDDEEDEGGAVASSDDERRDVVNIDTWLNKPDVRFAYQCTEVQIDGYTFPSHLLVTATHLYGLREIPRQRGMAWVQQRRALGSIVKITSKKRHPELITFKYGSNDDDQGIRISAADRFLIPQAGEATKRIKQQIMKVLDTLDT